MQHADVVARLRARAASWWLAYDGVRPGDEHAARHRGGCRDAWSLLRDEDGWWVVSGFGDGWQMRFDTEHEACVALLEHVESSSEHGVRALELDELPSHVARVVRASGRLPVEGSGLVAVDGAGSMAYRMVETRDGVRLERPSIVPPMAGSTVIDRCTLEDACRMLVVAVGEALPWRPGTARHGLPRRLDAEARLERARQHTLERLVDAYLGAPEGVLDELAAPAAVELLDDALLARDGARGWSIMATDGPHGVRFTCLDVDYVLRRDGAEFVVLQRPERSNLLRELLRTRDLDLARAALLARLD